MSLLMEKQKVQGTGAPDGLSRTQWEYTLCVVFSNAWLAKFSQYSTTDWFSNSCPRVASVDLPRERGPARRETTHLVDVLPPPDELLLLPAREHAELRPDEADLARPPPRHCRCSTERDQLIEFLRTTKRQKRPSVRRTT